MKKFAIVLTAGIALILCGPAEGHTLWKSKADRISWRVSKGLCDEHPSCTEYDVSCMRRHAHRVDCDLGMYWTEYDDLTDTEEEYYCSTSVKWYYRAHDKPHYRLVRFTVLYSDCEI